MGFSLQSRCSPSQSFSIVHLKNMKLGNRVFTFVAISSVWCISSVPAIASTFSLSNGSGDGSLTLDLDTFGFINSAVYDPIGDLEAVNQISNSGLAIGLGDDHRSFLNLVGEEISREQTSATSATSVFSVDGLEFNLEQTLDSIFEEDSQTGSLFTQTYTITNTSHAAIDFELLRFLDDVDEVGSSEDGGGRLFANNHDIVFRTDTATNSPDDPTFIGITAQGGTIPLEGRYDLDSSGDLLARISAGEELTDTVRGDGIDGDHFIDSDMGTDTAIALNNLFSLDAGETITYTTQTIFGDAPESEETEFVLTATIEEPNVFGKELTLVANYFLSQGTPDLDSATGSGLFEITYFEGQIFDAEGNFLADVGFGSTDRMFTEVFNPTIIIGSFIVNPDWLPGEGQEQFELDLLFESTTDPDIIPSQAPGNFDSGSVGVFVDGTAVDTVAVGDAAIVLAEQVPEPNATFGLLGLLGLGWLMKKQKGKVVGK